MTEASEADHERLDHDRDEHLASRRAERSQRRELARALGDRDRQRVAITNAPTKSAMPPNASRKFCRNEMNAFVSSTRPPSACAAPVRTWVPGGRMVADLGDELLRRDAVLRRHADLVELAHLGEEVLRGREVEARERGAADRVDGAELDEARDAEAARPGPGPGRRSRRRLRGPSSPRSTDVDHDLAVLRARRPRSSVRRVERRLRRVDAEAEVGGAAEGDRLAVGADQLGLAADAADRLRDVRQRLHLARARDSAKGGATCRCRSGRTRSCP